MKNKKTLIIAASVLFGLVLALAVNCQYIVDKKSCQYIVDNGFF